MGQPNNLITSLVWFNFVPSLAVFLVHPGTPLPPKPRQSQSRDDRQPACLGGVVGRGRFAPNLASLAEGIEHL